MCIFPTICCSETAYQLKRKVYEDVESFLDEIELLELYPLFRDQGVNMMEVLVKLKEEDLSNKVGVERVGDIKTIIRKCEEWTRIWTESLAEAACAHGKKT